MYRKNEVRKGLCLFLLLGCVAVAQWDFQAFLTGSSEVPPNASAATGTATLVLNAEQTRLTMHLTVFGLDLNEVTGLHIHNAPVASTEVWSLGLSASIMILTATCLLTPRLGRLFRPGPTGGQQHDLADQLNNLFAGNLYINVHTPTFPGGEIRGQIVPEPATVTLMLLGSLGLLRRKRIAS